MKPYILVVNDDGINSEGLMASVRAAAAVGDVLVVAPTVQQTAMGRAFPRTPDVGIANEVPDFMEGVKAYALHGSPGYCAMFGILELCERKPDLLVSGINIGLNVGFAITTSGTIGACFEALSLGIPSLAVSLEVTEEKAVLEESVGRDLFRNASEITEYWIRKVLDGMGEHPEYRFLNVNVPSKTVSTDEYRMTFIENQNYYNHERPPKGRDISKPFVPGYYIEVDVDALHQGSDIQTVFQDRLTSVTPMTTDLTRTEKSRF